MRKRLLAIGLFAACTGSTAAGSGRVLGVPARPGDPIEPGGTPAVATRVDLPAAGKPVAAATAGGRRRGVPHFAQISGIVLDAGGTRALTRDVLGGVRIWPALDGSLEPQKVPVTAPDAMAVEARKDGTLAGFIDTAGIVSLVRLDAEGLPRATATLPPDTPFVGIVLLAGGERVAAVRSDQRVILLDADGQELSHVSMRGGRVIAMHAAGAQLVAVIQTAGKGDKPVFQVQALDTTDDKLAWLGSARTLSAPVSAFPQINSAASPDGSLISYFSMNDSGETTVRVARVDSGKELKFDTALVASSPTTMSIGFVDNQHVQVANMSGTGWVGEISDDGAVAISMPMESSSSTPAYAAGLRAAGYQAGLVLHRDGGDVAYLGYSDLGPTAGSLSPDGESAAWTTNSGAVVIQRFDGSEDLRIKGDNEWFGSVATIDDDHVIASRSDGEIVMIDSHTGAELAREVVSASSPYFIYDGTTKLLGVLRDTGTIWVMTIDPSAKEPFGDPIAISDGASNFAMLDPDLADGDVVMTLDASMNVHRYSPKVLEGGVTTREIKKAQRGTVGYSYGYNRRGEWWTLGTNTIELADGKNSTSVPTGNVGPTSAFLAPHGDQIGAVVAPGIGSTLQVVDRKGKALWSMSSSTSIYGAWWSEDESRALVLGQGGAVVVDASTGQRVATAYGWAYGLTTQLPATYPTGMDPGFD